LPFLDKPGNTYSPIPLSTATSEPLLGDSNGDLFIPIADGSEPTKAQSGHGRAWVSSGAVTWDDFKGTPPPEERKADAGGDANAEIVSGFQFRSGTRIVTSPEKMQPPPATATQREKVGTETSKNGTVVPKYKDVEVQNPPVAYRSTATIPDAKESAYMDKNDSWATDSARRDPGLLDHERYHVETSEIAAEMASKQVQAVVGVGVATDPKTAKALANDDLERQRLQIERTCKVGSGKRRNTMTSRQTTARIPSPRQLSKKRSTRSSRKREGSNFTGIATALLIAGVIFLSCGCSRRAPEDDAGGRVSPLQEREVPDPFVDEIPPLPLAAPDPSATLSLERDTYEVALGSELAVCERLAWKHLEDVNGWTRTWSVTRWPDVGEELTAIIGKNVRTDTGLVVLDRESGDWVEMEGGGGSHFVIEPISHNAAGRPSTCVSTDCAL